VKCGCFVKSPDGQFVPTQEWGASDFDSLHGAPLAEAERLYGVLVLGPKNGKEAVILRLITGAAAADLGDCDVMVILEERSAPN